ncbi:MAG: haloacid dehalogenase-like hydrolase [Actinomycetes bacterium]
MDQEPATPVVGFDLDMTLVDSRPGILDTLHALADEVPGPEAAVLHEPGLLLTLLRSTLDDVFALRFPAERATELADRFRVLYVDVGVPGTTALPGALEAVDHVRALGGRCVVVTAKYEPNAHRCLRQVGLEVDAVHGWLHGRAKAAALQAERALLYVGDTTSDMEAAHHAGAQGLAIATGTHDTEALLAAGARAVLSSLTEFPGWWDAEAATLGLPD